MNDRFDDKIRGFVAELVNDPPATPEIDFGGLESSGLEVLRQFPRRRRWVPAVVAVGAACVMLIAVGLPVLFFGGSDAIVVVESATATTSAISTPVAAVPAPPQLDAWQRVGAGVMDSVVGLLDITVADSRLVAVGVDPGDDFRQDGVVFVSEDGVDWIRLAADDPALTTGNVLMYGIAEGGPGLVAGGMSCEDNEFPCLAGPYPTVWTSIDGTAWTRTPVEQGERVGAVLDVLVSDHGIVATGGVTQPTPDGGASSSPTVWLSVDGTSWSRVWQGAAVRDTEFGSGPGASVLALGPDGLIAGAGSAYNESGDGVAAVWVSSNAVDWIRVDPESVEFASDAGHGAFMSDIVWGPRGFVAVGGDGSRAAVWTSTDGVTWTRIDTTQAPIGSARPLSAIAVLDGGYVAAGPDGNAVLVTLWTSTDGISWDRVQVLGEGNADAIVSSEGGIAVAGQTPSDDNYHAAVWMGLAFDPAQPPPDPVSASQDEPAPTAPLIESVPAGRSCKAVAADGFSYAEAVSYWIQYEMPPDFNLDTNAVPCEAAYLTAEIARVFGDPAAASVTLVSSHATQTFVATGAAVDGGLVCAEGTFDYTDNPELTEPGVRLRWEDRYTCGDGSGTFLLGVDEYIHDGVAAYGVWNIVSGTGDYQALNGGGGTDSDLAGNVSTGRLWFETN
jgi:hypothetical protein